MRPNPFRVQSEARARETRRLIQAGVPARGGGQRVEDDGDVSGALSGATVTLYGRLDWTPLTDTEEEAGGFILG